MREERKEIKEVKYFDVRYKCECDGEMRATGLVYASAPPKYLHKCDDCGKEAVLDNTYPRIDKVVESI